MLHYVALCYTNAFLLFVFSFLQSILECRVSDFDVDLLGCAYAAGLLLTTRLLVRCPCYMLP